ncbi:MAG: hypothetical protein Ta2D_12580 [Rickettsiales bacterium]|nr:MAG: hypothetical protein Ta2D_12580 [Rickettsiales bacterium]
MESKNIGKKIGKQYTFSEEGLRLAIENFLKDPVAESITFNARYDGTMTDLCLKKHTDPNEKNFYFYTSKNHAPRECDNDIFFRECFDKISNGNAPYTITQRDRLPEQQFSSTPSSTLKENKTKKSQVKSDEEMENELNDIIKQVNGCDDATIQEYIKNTLKKNGNVVVNAKIPNSNDDVKIKISPIITAVDAKRKPNPETFFETKIMSNKNGKIDIHNYSTSDIDAIFNGIDLSNFSVESVSTMGNISSLLQVKPDISGERQINESIEKINKCGNTTKQKFIKDILERGGDVNFDTKDGENVFIFHKENTLYLRIDNKPSVVPINIKDIDNWGIFSSPNISDISIKSISSIEAKNLPEVNISLNIPEGFTNMEDQMKIKEYIDKINKCDDTTKQKIIKDILENGGEVKFNTKDYKDVIFKETDTNYSFYKPKNKSENKTFSSLFIDKNGRRINDLYIFDIDRCFFLYGFSEFSIKSISIDLEKLPPLPSQIDPIVVNLQKSISSIENKFASQYSTASSQQNKPTTSLKTQQSTEQEINNIKNMLKEGKNVTIKAKLLNKKNEKFPDNVIIKFKSSDCSAAMVVHAKNLDTKNYDKYNYSFEIYPAENTERCSHNKFSIFNVDNLFQEMEEYGNLSDISITKPLQTNLQSQTNSNSEISTATQEEKPEKTSVYPNFAKFDTSLNNFASENNTANALKNVRSYIIEQEKSKVALGKEGDIYAKAYLCEKLFNNTLSALKIDSPAKIDSCLKLVFKDFGENSPVAKATKERISQSMKNQKSQNLQRSMEKQESSNLVKKYGCF